MTLAVVGIGMVSPLARTPEQHAFYVRGEIMAPEIAADDGTELLAFSQAAIAGATNGGSARRLIGSVPAELAKRLGAEHVGCFFGALAKADAEVSINPESEIVVLGADAPVSVDTPPTLWDGPLLRASRGAACVVVTSLAAARARGRDVLAVISGAATALGASNDDNDEVVDGDAMTSLLRGLRASPAISASFGQHQVDDLRRSDWAIATARNAERIHPEALEVCVETALGRLGNAAGAFAIVYSIAVVRHRAYVERSAPEGPFVAWAIERTGERGLAIVEAVAGASVQMGTLAPAIARYRPSDEADGDVVANCIEAMSMLARHRDERPFADRAETERRMLCRFDAVIAARPHPESLLDLVDEDDLWSVWPIAFTLALIDGDPARVALDSLVESLDSNEAARIFVDGLLASASENALAQVKDWQRSSSPWSRAVALEIQSHTTGVTETDLRRALESEYPAFACAAIRAIARRRTPLLESVAARMRDADADVAWEAARALALGRDARALEALRSDWPLLERFGERALELAVLVGEIADLPIVQRIVERTPTTEGTLSALGRFGAPKVFSYLAHYLADAELSEPAAAALEVIFGNLVPAREAKRAAAWQRAVSEAAPDPTQRLRRGAPWSADVALRECASGALSRVEIELRRDEIAARVGRSELWSDLARFGARAT